MRIIVIGVLLMALVGCGPSGQAPDAPTSSTAIVAPTGIDPVRIKRIRAELPEGFEVADVAPDANLAGLAGYGGDWVADPPACAGLLGPRETAETRGLSASGTGGTVYVTVMPVSGDPVEAAGPTEGGPPARGTTPLAEPAGDCSAWTMSYQHSTARVQPAEAPQIDGATTAGLRADSVTAVESAARTESTIRWLTAEHDDQLVAVTVITTPGNAEGPLTDDYATGLLVKAVSVLHR